MRTIETAFIKRLRSGDQRNVNLQVYGSLTGTINLELKYSNQTQRFSFPDIDLGFKSWNSSLDSLTMHESPDWFNNAKFGMFIHWRPYAVPGWGNFTPNEVD